LLNYVYINFCWLWSFLIERIRQEPDFPGPAGIFPDDPIQFPDKPQKFPVRARREFPSTALKLLSYLARLVGPRGPNSTKFPVFSQLAGNLVYPALARSAQRSCAAIAAAAERRRPCDGANAGAGVGLATADRLADEAFSHPLRDQRAVARYGGLTGAPDESSARRREKGLARAGNARVRRAMIQLAWRFLIFQKDSVLARWYWQRTADHRGTTRKTMIVALARKLLIALWRLATAGEIPAGVGLRPAL